MLNLQVKKEKPFTICDSKPARIHFIQGNITGRIFLKNKQKKMEGCVPYPPPIMHELIQDV